MKDYYGLLKGSGGAKSINQHDGFGDLLSECRVSAKEKIDEGQRPFTKQETQHAIDDIKDRIADAEPDDYEDKESYDSAISEWEMGIARLEAELKDAPDEAEFESKVYEDKIVKKYAKLIPDYDYDTDDKELDRIYTIVDNLYPEASDEEKDYLQNIMDEIMLISNQHERDEELEAAEETDESKVNESRLVVSFTTDKEKNFMNSLVDNYKGSLYGITPLEDEIIIDGPNHELSNIVTEIAAVQAMYPGISIEESKVNELDEPDLERPEKARRRPKKKRPVRPEPEVDRIPKEEPEEPRPDDTIKEEPPEKDPDEVPEIGEPDRDEVPPPPEELREPEQPIEMRKEYLGRSKETHFYFITTEGEGGVVADFVVADQEGVKKYSAKEKDIDVSEENIAEFLIQAYRDMDIAQIERSIFMKYLYPEIIKRGPEEEMVEEPELEDEFGKEKKPLEPGGDEEEEFPRESRKITDSVDEAKTTSELEDKELDSRLYKLEKLDALLPTDCKLDVQINKIKSEIQKRKSKKNEDETDEKCNKKLKESHLIEMKVTDGIGNEFDVNLTDDGTMDTVIDINGREFRFSGEFASMWRDEHGDISEEGLEELALDALAMMEEEEYQELLANGRNEPEELPDEKGLIDVDKEAETQPEHELEVTGGIDEPIDDVDMSKGDINRPLKYPPEKKPGDEFEEPAGEELDIAHGDDGKFYVTRGEETVSGPYNTEEEASEVIDRMEGKTTEGKNQPGIRDGTGPANDSVQRKIKGDVGKRKPAGMKCSKENKENENIEGDNVMDKKLSDFTDEQLINELAARKEKTEGIDPKKEDSEDTKIKKLAEDGEVKEEKIDETDVAKGAKALVQLLKDAVKAGDYAKAAEYAQQCAEIEAMVPAEAEAEASKDVVPAERGDKAPEKKPDKDDKPKEDDKPDKEDDELDKGADEKKKPPVCDKCGIAHWPFDKCNETEGVDEAKDKKDKEAKAKKEKAEKDAKAKKDKEEKAKKDKEAKAKKAKAKKESKIPVEGTEDITERKGLNLLNELLGIK